MAIYTYVAQLYLIVLEDMLSLAPMTGLSKFGQWKLRFAWLAAVGMKVTLQTWPLVQTMLWLLQLQTIL
jgi:hypothetical protein